MNSKVYSLVSLLGMALLLIIGVVLSYNAMQVQYDKETEQSMSDFASVDSAISYTAFLMIASLAAVLLFTVWGIILNPKKFIPSLIGIGVVGVIFLIAMSMADGTPTGKLLEIEAATEFAVKWTDIGLIMTAALGIIAVALLVFEVIRGALGLFSK